MKRLRNWLTARRGPNLEPGQVSSARARLEAEQDEKQRRAERFLRYITGELEE